ncbi:MAG: hypothetical protein OSJ65_06315 [Bacilli bacterium]|nr:hypothetical protein [Bacilli bacterium]
MRIDRILGVILSILVISFIVLKQFNTDEQPFELIGDNGYMENSSISYQDKVLNKNESTKEIIEYTNTNNYPVEIKNNDIIITCTGSGSTKEEDEALAEKNYHINAKFSETKNGSQYSSLKVPRKSKAFIHVVSEYLGDLPNNSVSCEYKLNIQAD